MVPPPTVCLCYCLCCFPPRGAVSLVQMLGFHVWLEHFHCLSGALYSVDNGRGRHQVAVKPRNLFAQSGDWDMYGWKWRSQGLQASHIGHVVVRGMCRNYMRLWPESKLWQRWPHPSSPTRLHQTVIWKAGERLPGWHQWWSELLNRSVFGSRNLQKPLNSTSGGLGRSVYVYTFVKEELFVQCVFPFGNCVWVWEKCIECAIWTPLKRGISMAEFALADPAIAK